MKKIFACVLSVCILLLAGCDLSKTTNVDVAQMPEGVSVRFINVGQGDSALIDCGEYEILIDGGSRSAGSDVCKYIKDYVDGNIEIVAATHPHEDHIGGLIDVLNEYKVDMIIDSGKEHTSKTYEEYLSAAEESGAEFIPDDDMEFAVRDNIVFKVIECDDNNKELNNNSVVTLLDCGGFRFLFMGDTEEGIERKYIGKFEKVNVLKMGHHGSRTSSSDEFLAKTMPEYAVVSCGEGNDYGHPHSETIQKLEEHGILYYRTDEGGNIIFKAPKIEQ